MYRLLAVTLLAAIQAWPVAAGPIEDGTAAYNRGDYATALQIWRPLADRGDPDIQVFLGNMFAFGQGMPRDYVAATQWYRLAADYGQPDAQYNLGLMYDGGHGLPQDFVQAHVWFALAIANFPASRTKDRADADEGLRFVAAKMTPEQIAEARTLASAWKPRSR